MSRIIKIATRSSPLAMWQANKVKNIIEQHGYKCELVAIETSGDIDLTQPVYSFGVTGIFTKQLDISLLNEQTDIAVHSLKDVPIKLAEGLTLAACLDRGSAEDVILVKDKNFLNDTNAKAKIASSSLRRRAQWRAKYKNHEVGPVRGNVQTRIKKLEDDKTLSGMIFAKAGLERLGLLSEKTITLDWMNPAPAQGIIGISCRDDDFEMLELCSKINHSESFTEGEIERQFLSTLLGGCSVPIGALAKIKNDRIHFKGTMHAVDGSKGFTINEVYDLSQKNEAGAMAAKKLLTQKGAVELLEIIRNMNLQKDFSGND